MRMDYKVRDPIHGYIPFSKLEKQIIDTILFQRLRGLKQLSNADYAYPGATHTRFSHSIGVMHVASLMANHLALSETQIKKIRIAALLHDIGHAPHSHVFEDAMIKLNINFDHENYGQYLIRHNHDISEILDDNLVKETVSILSGDPPSLEHDIITSQLDADRLDYLLRDSYYCGVKYGLYDFERILFCLDKIQDGDKNSLCISIKGINAVDSLRLARYQMYKQVYFHKVRTACDSMICRSIQIGYVEDMLFRRQIEAIKNNKSNILQLNDYNFESLLSTNKSKECNKFIINLKCRSLLKICFDSPISEIVSSDLRYLLTESDDKKEIFDTIENFISERYHVKKEWVISTIIRGTPLDKKRSQIKETPLLVRDPKFREPRDFIHYTSIVQEIKNEKDRLIILVPENFRNKIIKEAKTLLKLLSP